MMLALPCAAIRLAGTNPVNCVALTNVVVSAEPFHWTLAPETNPVPFTVSMKAVFPAFAEAGLSVVIAGVLAGLV